MMSSKGQVYAIKIVDFISKTEGPVYFELACTSCTSIVPSQFDIARFLSMNTSNDLAILSFHRCAVTSNDTYSIQSPAHYDVINSSIPVTADGEFESCDVITRNGSEVTAVTQCTSWVYDKSVFEESVVSELDIVCGNSLFKSHTTMMMFAGKMTGSLIVGLAADRLGRKPVMVTLILILAAASVGNAFVDSLATLFVTRFFTGMATTGSFIVTRLIVTEYVQPTARSKVALISDTCNLIGGLSLVPIAYTRRNWQDIQLIILWPIAVVVILSWVIPESARWLMTRGRYEDAQRAVERAAKINRRTIHPDIMTSLNADKDKEAATSQSPLSLFQSAKLAVRWFAIYFNRLVISMMIYGLTLNVTTLGGNIFLNFALSLLAGVTGSFIAAFVVERVSRKYFFMTCLLTAGSLCLMTFIPVLAGADPWVVTLFSTVGKMFTSMSLLLINVYAAELFPTSCRGFGLATTSMFGQVGGIASPYVADLNIYVSGQFGVIMPQLVFGAAGISGGLVTLVLPDTRNRKLPDTIEDAENFGEQAERH